MAAAVLTVGGEGPVIRAARWLPPRLRAVAVADSSLATMPPHPVGGNTTLTVSGENQKRRGNGRVLERTSA